MSQPKWKTLTKSDYRTVFVDETGVYDPEMVIVQEIDDSDEVESFRFALERLRRYTDDDGSTYVVPFKYQPDWPHHASAYKEWYMSDVGKIAESVGSTADDFVEALCSDDPLTRAEVYEAIGGYHGFINLDGYPTRSAR